MQHFHAFRHLQAVGAHQVEGVHTLPLGSRGTSRLARNITGHIQVSFISNAMARQRPATDNLAVIAEVVTAHLDF